MKKCPYLWFLIAYFDFGIFQMSSCKKQSLARPLKSPFPPKKYYEELKITKKYVAVFAL